MSNAQLTFIIPVRHQDNSKNWALLKQNLSETLRSIVAQDSNNWKAVVVANRGADLPELPLGVDVKYVDFPPNPQFEKDNCDIDVFRHAVRFDKGRRILAGLLHARPTGYVMVVDDDDLISTKLASFVSRNSKENGWFIFEGYLWNDGGHILYRYSDFSLLCGTSHIIRADLLKLPPTIEEASDDYICNMLGSHIFIREHLTREGTPLKPLPFVGSIYRMGHADSHSRSMTLFKRLFPRRRDVLSPRKALMVLLRIKTINARIKKEYWGC